MAEMIYIYCIWYVCLCESTTFCDLYGAVAVITINLLWGCVCLLAGFLTGYLIRGLQNNVASQTAAINAAQSETTAHERTVQFNQLQERFRECKEQLELTLAEKFSLRGAVDTARARLQQQQVSSRQQLDLLEKRNIELKDQIESISAKVFADNSHRMTELTESHLQQVLAPLRAQIGDFKQKVEDVYDRECRDRTLLKAEIGQLKNLNERISADAVNLSNALRGDNKALGNWGELILERVLERAGLQRGKEYDREVSLQNSDGRRYRPDALLYLPGKKSIVIDSKASIKSYEKTLQESCDEQLRKKLLREHVGSIRKHIDGLSEKGYESLDGINSLNFVLMFVPVEAALQAALEFDESLYKEAYDRDVVLVGPSSLMVTCRTIQNVWHSELQNKNAAVIAKKAGELVDKFNGFVSELDGVASALDTAVVSVESARRKLVSGRGNLVSRAKKLQDLGASSGKVVALPD